MSKQFSPSPIQPDNLDSSRNNLLFNWTPGGAVGGHGRFDRTLLLDVGGHGCFDRTPLLDVGGHGRAHVSNWLLGNSDVWGSGTSGACRRMWTPCCEKEKEKEKTNYFTLVNWVAVWES